MAMIKRRKMWYTDDWHNGHRIHRKLDKNERIAQGLYKDFREMLNAQKLGITPKNTSVDYFADKYLIFKKSERSLKTWDVARLAFKRLKEVSPIKRLSELTPELLGNCKGLWKELGYTATAIGGYVTAIKTAMRKAEEWKYVSPQSWRTIEVHHPPARLEYFTPDELATALSLCFEPWYTAALLMGRCGLRSAEVRHLRWDDVLWTRRSLWIHQKPCDQCVECRHGGNVWKAKGTKPGKPPKERHVDMPVDVEYHLRTLARPQGFALGSLIPQVRYWHWFRDTLSRRMGVKTNPHKFRHSYGAHLASNGVSLEKIGELMGHTDPKTTKIYAHLMPSSLRDAVDRLPVLGSGLVLPLASSKRMARKRVEAISDGKHADSVISTTAEPSLGK